jgi:hypothetical protein
MDQSYSMDYLLYFIYAFELLSFRDNKNCKYFFLFPRIEVKKKIAVSGTASPENWDYNKNEVRTGRQETKKVHILWKVVPPSIQGEYGAYS